MYDFLLMYKVQSQQKLGHYVPNLALIQLLLGLQSAQ